MLILQEINRYSIIHFLNHNVIMAVNYKGFGPVNTREMFKRGIDGGLGVPAFNF